MPKEKAHNNTKALTSKWMFKKNPNGTLRGRLNTHGFKQIEGVHYETTYVAAPVTNEVTIRVVMVIIMVFKLHSELLDVKGTFLK